MGKISCLGIALALILLSPVSGADGIADQVKLCSTCHGAEGVPSDPNIPILWGQEFYYIYVQLKDFKAGRRANPIMAGIVQGLEKEQMQQIAQYFSEKPWPRIGYAAPDGSASKAGPGLVAGQCVQCHLGGYEGNSRVPRLAGQHPQYLSKTMVDFKSKQRLNSPAKSSLMAAYSNEVIDAMAAYLGGL